MSSQTNPNDLSSDEVTTSQDFSSSVRAEDIKGQLGQQPEPEPEPEPEGMMPTQSSIELLPPVKQDQNPQNNPTLGEIQTLDQNESAGLSSTINAGDNNAQQTPSDPVTRAQKIIRTMDGSQTEDPTNFYRAAQDAREEKAA